MTPEERERERDKKLDKILGYLHNDKDTNQPGLIADFHAHKEKMETFVTKYNEEVAVKKAKLGLLATIAGAVGAFLYGVGKLMIDKYHG